MDELPLCCPPLEYLQMKLFNFARNFSIQEPVTVKKICATSFYFPQDDVTNATRSNDARDVISSLWFSVSLGFISSFGLVANLLNLVVLGNRRVTSRLDGIGRSVNNGLMALAISDFLFCCVVLPHAFLPIDDVTGDEPDDVTLVSVEKRAAMLYRIYGIALIGVLQMSSIWLVVLMSLARYSGVTDPLHSRNRLWARHTVKLIVAIFICALIVTSPLFMHRHVASCRWEGSVLLYEEHLFKSERSVDVIIVYITWVWPVLASFVPILILFVFNVLLIVELRRASKHHHSITRTHSNNEQKRTVTLTLVCIIIMALVLVAPAEILRYINPFSWGGAGARVAQVANLLQALNFSLNFILYVCVNSTFRQTTSSLLQLFIRRLRRDSTGNEPVRSRMSTLTHLTSSTARLKAMGQCERLNDDFELIVRHDATSRSMTSQHASNFKHNRRSLSNTHDVTIELEYLCGDDDNCRSVVTQ